MILLSLVALIAWAGPDWKHENFVREQIARVPDAARVLVLSDDEHRRNNIRQLTLQIVRAFAAR